MSNQIEKLYIDSRDRQIGQKSNDFTVSIGNFRQLTGLTSLYIDSMVFPNSLYPINSNNNKLYMNMRRYSTTIPTMWTNQYFTVTLPEGSYTPAELINTLNPLIASSYNAAYPSNPQTLVTEMLYNEKTSVYSIQVTSQYGRASSTEPGGAFRDYLVVLDETSDYYEKSFIDSLNYLLGFENMSYSYPTNITPFINSPIIKNISSTSLPRISGEQYLFLHCSLISNSESSTKNTSENDILYKINLVSGYSDIIYSATGHSASNVTVNTQSTISNIRFYITDSRNNQVDMRGGEYSFILSLKYD